VVADSIEEKAQQNNTWTEIPKNTAKGKDKQRDTRRTFKMLREV